MTKEELYKKYLDNPKIVDMWYVLSKLKKCIWCGKSFDEGITQKHPEQEFSFIASEIFTGDFLFHAQTTHGYTIDNIDYFLENIWKD